MALHLEMHPPPLLHLEQTLLLPSSLSPAAFRQFALRGVAFATLHVTDDVHHRQVSSSSYLLRYLLRYLVCHVTVVYAGCKS